MRYDGVAALEVENVRAVSRVDAEIEQVQRMLTQVEELVGVLEQRLQPVLVPVDPRLVPGEEKESAPPPASPLAMLLDRLAARLAECGSGLSGILDRLEV